MKYTSYLYSVIEWNRPDFQDFGGFVLLFEIIVASRAGMSDQVGKKWWCLSQVLKPPAWGFVDDEDDCDHFHFFCPMGSLLGRLMASWPLAQLLHFAHIHVYQYMFMFRWFDKKTPRYIDIYIYLLQTNRTWWRAYINIRCFTSVTEDVAHSILQARWLTPTYEID